MLVGCQCDERVHMAEKQIHASEGAVGNCHMD